MGFVSVLGYAQQLIRSTLLIDDVVIDATLGTGNDADFLHRLIRSKGCLYGFDIQPEAIRRSNERLIQSIVTRGPASSLAPYVFFLDSHAHMNARLPASSKGKVGAVMFNLGYLPDGANQQIITNPNTTLDAIGQACMYVRAGGVVTIVVYPGHDGGYAESESVLNWCAQLPQQAYQVLRYQMWNRSESAPYLLAIQKKA